MEGEKQRGRDRREETERRDIVVRHRRGDERNRPREIDGGET
jgi:hypothetical protein